MKGLIRNLPRVPARARIGIAFVIFLIVAAGVSFKGQAATPAAGTLTETSGPIVYSGAGPFFVTNQTEQVMPPVCNGSQTCDDFALTVSLSPATYETHLIRVEIKWALKVADFDLYVYGPGNLTGNNGGVSFTGADPEVLYLAALPGSYNVRVVPALPLGQNYTGTVSLVPKPVAAPQGTGPTASYTNYVMPSSLPNYAAAGEPSIGANWATGRIMFQANTTTARVTFNDSLTPATATWENKSAQTSATTLDPILFTDHRTNRTFVSQLAGVCSLASFTDNDGDSWIPSQGCGIPAAVDHQTVGGGPFAAPLTAVPPSYNGVFYYCSQDVYTSICAVSPNGGLSFGPGVPIFTQAECGGIHGHVKVGPDGTAYVPAHGCIAGAGQQGVAVSEDNGISWTVRTVPGSIVGGWDPSVGIGTAGTVYFGYLSGDGRPHIAVSRDHGKHWTDDQDVGGPFGIQNMAFPAVVAGDDDRAAYAFLGADRPGNVKGAIWRLYIAHTYDGGRTWVTSDATPNDPVQRGAVCNAGLACTNDRNLLDFMDITVDLEGRVLVGYADGCVGGCVTSSDPPLQSTSKVGVIARQVSGRRLFAQFDSDQ
jgi:hypothetical protein